MSMFTIAFAKDAMECSVWSSPGEARAALSADLDIANEYGSGSGFVYVFSLADESGKGVKRSTVGIQMDSEFESPTILGNEWGRARWIGCNSNLYRISSSMTIDREIDLGSKFDSFRYISHLDRLIVLAEIGLFAVCGSGEIDWHVSLDVVTDVHWADESVMIFQMDSPGVRVDLRNGSILDSPVE
ncbi:hypothetical protein HTV45_09150 [Streptomyces sp. CHD11]|uniref:hypothetical protein n=1 Tax=Streptomyces sp. CHD11 TaxID=2741325 RepID=UPI001BFCC316|nr:hypothetical protein [Streptomyces sp. CHD11]MBT3151052.1 hypothetical protein [Streptomyces sp. CHD11]